MSTNVFIWIKHGTHRWFEQIRFQNFQNYPPIFRPRISDAPCRGLCRMKMLPVMILANYHSSARSAVSERPNSSARLVSQCPNSSARLVSQCPNSGARLVFPMFQVELRLAFECSNSNTNDRQFEVCAFVAVFFYNKYYFLSQYAFHVYVLIVLIKA